MNLFRSEEHAKNWPSYDPISAESIMPLADWAQVFSGPLHRNRMEPGYLSRIHEYAPKLFQSLKELGKEGRFWTPE